MGGKRKFGGGMLTGPYAEIFSWGARRVNFSKKLESEGAKRPSLSWGTFAFSKVKLKDFVHTFGEFCEIFSNFFRRGELPPLPAPPPICAYGHGRRGGQEIFLQVFFFFTFQNFRGAIGEPMPLAPWCHH